MELPSSNKSAPSSQDERRSWHQDGEKVGEIVKYGNKPDCGDCSNSPSQDNTKQVQTQISRERFSLAISSRPSSSNPTSQEEEFESTRQEMGEVREENERLKTILSRIVKDYQSLQMHFFDVVHQEQQSKKPSPPIPIEEEEQELVSLSLGTSSNCQRKEEKHMIPKSKNQEEGLALGLDCKFEGCNEQQMSSSPDNSSGEGKEEDNGEPWAGNKATKSARPGEEDQGSQMAHVKKARVSVRARCDAPTMNDGCQWRKYGQKIAKGNPCPRAYYRCTVAPACPVRKQVQRCAEDMSILITTYEGNHNHPLPISATAMASTTSAAASMLMSGSSASRPAISGAPATDMSFPNLNFSLQGNNRPRQYYLPSTTTISSSPSYPTITLDLAAPSPAPALGSQFGRFPMRNSPGSFSFSSESGAVQPGWCNGYMSKSFGKPWGEYLQKAAVGSQALGGGALAGGLTESIAKAITSDPSFQSALAAAITSYVGGQAASGGATAPAVIQTSMSISKGSSSPPPMADKRENIN